MWSYPVVLECDVDGRVLVNFPDFPEAHTYGDDEEEALVRARDALATIVDAYIKDKQPIPYPSRGYPTVKLPALTEAKIGLYRAMREAHITKTQLAKRLNWHLPQVDRLLDVHHNSRVDQLEAAFTVLGKELHFDAFTHRPLNRRLAWHPQVTMTRRTGGGSRRTAGGGIASPQYLVPPERTRVTAQRKRTARKSTSRKRR
jgi:antitoxin HicB